MCQVHLHRKWKLTYVASLQMHIAQSAKRTLHKRIQINRSCNTAHHSNLEYSTEQNI